MTGMSSVVLGTGSALPMRVVSNDELAQTIDTTDEWIVQRTGIRTRYIASAAETTSTLAVLAARRALAAAALGSEDIDLIVVATATPDDTFPATATRVQAGLGMRHGAAFDVHAVCSGFLFAMATADAHLRVGLATRALVIGAETFSRILDWSDRTTCVLFGDGAGAVVMEAQEGEAAAYGRGILAARLRSDGIHRDKLFVDGGPSTSGTVGRLRMQGREVFKYAVSMIADVIEDVLASAGAAVDDIDWFVPHQANLRIISSSAKKLGIPMEKVVVTVDRHANTSAASIPLALDVAAREGRIKPGDLVLLEALGGGFTWGAILLRW